MGTAIVDHTIGSDLKAAPDEIWAAEAITTSAITSAEFLAGQTAAGIEIKVVANAAMTIVATEVVTFEFQTSATSGGTFATYATVTLTGAVGNTVLAAGDELFRYVPDRELCDAIYSKIVVTPDTTSLASSVNAYIVAITN